LKKRRQEQYLATGKNEIPAPVFLSPGQIVWEEGKPVGHGEGSPLQMNNFRNRVFWKACDKAKIRRRRLHDTRHTFASILLMNGESPKYDPETTRPQFHHHHVRCLWHMAGRSEPERRQQPALPGEYPTR
jgi:integrase